MKVDNSSLTGESEPQERHALRDGSKKRPVEADNLVCNDEIWINSIFDRFGPDIGFQFYIGR